jgi:hypothetical protein
MKLTHVYTQANLPRSQAHVCTCAHIHTKNIAHRACTHRHRCIHRNTYICIRSHTHTHTYTHIHNPTHIIFIRPNKNMYPVKQTQFALQYIHTRTHAIPSTYANVSSFTKTPAQIYAHINTCTQSRSHALTDTPTHQSGIVGTAPSSVTASTTSA